MRCPSCGHENVSAGGSFCGACGKPLPAPAPSRADATSTAAPAAVSSSASASAAATGHRAGWILGAVGLAAAIAIAVVGATAIHHRVAAAAVVAGARTPATGELDSPLAAPFPVGPISVHPTVAATAAVPLGRNIVASSFGGEIENIRGAYGGLGITGEYLIDTGGADVWHPDTLGPPDTAGNQAIIYPQELVFSFYKRDTALVSALVVKNADNGSGPGSVEVWTSIDSGTGGFSQVAAARLTDTVPVQTVSFTPVMARYVKVRVDSGSPHGLQNGTDPDHRGGTPWI